MTATGLDYASEGRFTLGIGASGPQSDRGVSTAWHSRRTPGLRTIWIDRGALPEHDSDHVVGDVLEGTETLPEHG